MGKNKIVYLNKPINNKSEDLIGVSPYVDSIYSAINQGATMVAVTSKFGGGKSTISELLEVEMNDNKDSIGYMYNFIKINLWNHMDCPTANKMQIHKNFIYQLATQLGNYQYVSKRMSKNYGLIKFELKNKLSYFFLVVMIISMLSAYFVSNYISSIDSYMVDNSNFVYLMIMGLVIISVICGTYLCVKSELVFSSSRTEKNIVLEEHEIADIYKQIMVRKKKKHFVIVFEDIDRSSNKESVSSFLKEINKYYLYSTKLSKVRVTFILNLKRESDFNSGLGKENTVDYNKIFEYIIDVPPINIDNYDEILKGLLEDKKIDNSIIETLDLNNILDTPGMRWLILGNNLGIRDVKNRLNSVFLKYDFLKSISKNRISTSIRFECCAAACYLISEYADDFCKITDDKFEEIVNLSISKSLGKEWFENQEYKLSELFIDKMMLLLDNRLIDTNYRMYFYNFPERSAIYTLDESIVVNAILYGDKSEHSISKNIDIVVDSNSSLIEETINKIKQLGIKLPILVFENEKLFSLAIMSDYPFFEKSLSVYCNSKIKSSEVLNILKFMIFQNDNSNEYDQIRMKFLDVIVNSLNAEEVLRVRNSILKTEDLLKNKRLFFKPAPIITEEEINGIESIDTVTKLIDFDAENFTEKLFEAFHNSLVNSNSDEYTEEQLLIYSKAAHSNISDSLNGYYISFMKRFKVIIGFMEASLIVDMNNYKDEFIDIINETDSAKLKDSTLKIIKDFAIYDKLSESVCRKLKENNYLLEYILNMSILDVQEIDFTNRDNINAIKENRDIVIEFKNFISIRREIIRQKIYKEYTCLFEEDCESLHDEELKSGKIDEIIYLIGLGKVNSSNVEKFVAFFNESYRNPRETYSILKFISNIEDDLVEEAFYSLNLENIRYNKMSRENRENTLNLFYAKLDLTNFNNALDYMEFTSCLYTVLEKKVASYVRRDVECRKKYDRAIIGYNKLTRETVENLTNSEYLSVYSEEIEKDLYRNELYNHYIYSKTEREKEFKVEDSKLEDLYEGYLFVYNNKNLKNTSEIMGKNKDFLLMIVKNTDIDRIEDGAMQSFSSLNQNEILLERAFSLEGNYIDNYFESIAGFDNFESAKYFVDTVIDRSKRSILINNRIYTNIHEKLVDSNLKRKYTRFRNEMLG